jgi:prepilin-type N-terminal cleavage/methylation domain-containing protein
MKGRQIIKRFTKGFTIVELLVVVVVIGIIVGIVVVGYNSAQIKAENAKTLQAVNQYIKGATSYAVRNGAYPISTTFACLGTTATCARVSGSTTCGGYGAAAYDATFAGIIATEISPPPEPSAQTISCSGNQYKGAYYDKNDASSGKNATIVYYLRGNQTCSTSYGTLTRAQQEDVTFCRVALPILP